MVEQPEDYRWCTLGYLLQSGNKDDLLSLEFGVEQLNKLGFQERLAAYREFVYEVGALVTDKGCSIEPEILEKQQKKGFKISSLDHLKFRSRYFTDSAVIGSKAFIEEKYSQFEEIFSHRKRKKPVRIRGMGEVFSLRRLTS